MVLMSYRSVRLFIKVILMYILEIYYMSIEHCMPLSSAEYLQQIFTKENDGKHFN